MDERDALREHLQLQALTDAVRNRDGQPVDASEYGP